MPSPCALRRSCRQAILPVGRLLSRNLGSPDRKEGFFRYDEAYLQHPAAYPLDPVHLPLRPGTFNARRGEAGVHGVFDDSLPDAWGRTILAKRAGLDRARFSSAHLLGALAGTAWADFSMLPKTRRP